MVTLVFPPSLFFLHFLLPLRYSSIRRPAPKSSGRLLRFDIYVVTALFLHLYV